MLQMFTYKKSKIYMAENPQGVKKWPQRHQMAFTFVAMMYIWRKFTRADKKWPGCHQI